MRNVFYCSTYVLFFVIGAIQIRDDDDDDELRIFDAVVTIGAVRRAKLQANITTNSDVV